MVLLEKSSLKPDRQTAGRMWENRRSSGATERATRN